MRTTVHTVQNWTTQASGTLTSVNVGATVQGRKELGDFYVPPPSPILWPHRCSVLTLEPCMLSLGQWRLTLPPPPPAPRPLSWVSPCPSLPCSWRLCDRHCFQVAEISAKNVAKEKKFGGRKNWWQKFGRILPNNSEEQQKKMFNKICTFFKFLL